MLDWVYFILMSAKIAVGNQKQKREKSVGWITETYHQDIDPSPTSSAPEEEQDEDLIKRLAKTVYDLGVKNNMEEANLIQVSEEEE